MQTSKFELTLHQTVEKPKQHVQVEVVRLAEEQREQTGQEQTAGEQQIRTDLIGQNAADDLADHVGEVLGGCDGALVGRKRRSVGGQSIIIQMHSPTCCKLQPVSHSSFV